ncbi:MAG: branched-chain-amino-acid transaminase [Puniceicoccales bacterium]|jgi:branched-chain amino acid aminotransferase|nr:branched-chain-amino-acid transaminase [Puniceicoccales bacterium]
MDVYIDGKFYPKADAKISVFDHGLLYGDGIFEGIRVYNNCIFKLDEHLERLEYSAKGIAMELPWSRKEIADATVESCRRNGIVNGYIRMVVTRGVGDLGLSPRNCSKPTLIIIADTIKLYPEEFYKNGIKLITVPTRRMNVAALPPMIKSLNYLNNILAKIEALQHGFHECLLLNDQGYVSECSGDNLFLIHKGRLLTPASYAGALVGITRQSVMEIAAQLKLPMVETNLTRYDVFNADEAFLTGSAAEVVPVIELDGRQIGAGKPGKITGKILEAFRKKVTKDGTHIKPVLKKKTPAKK